MKPSRRSVYRYQDLKRLLSPASIAVFGASVNTASYATRTVAHLERSYTGSILRVNPKYERIGDSPCYPSIKALPEKPDCVVIAVPLEGVEAAVLECAEGGAGGALIFASGYAETGRADRIAMQDRLSAISRESGLRILGPNSLGFLNFGLRAAVTFTKGATKMDGSQPSGIGIVSQSGALGFSQAQAAQHAIALSHVLASGNSCDIDVTDTAAYLAEDPNCKSIICLFEGLADPQRLIEAGEIAWAADKPFIVCKLGTGARGAEAALSHTGSLAGSLEAYKAACERVGIIMLNDLEALIEAAAFFAKAPHRPSAKGIGVLGVSGGSLVVAADKAEIHDVPMPQPSEETRKLLEARIPEFGAARNPCDVTAMAGRDPALVPDSLKIMARDPAYGAFVYPQTSVNPTTGEELCRIGDACQIYGKHVCITWVAAWIGGTGAKEATMHPNLSIFHSTDRCFAVIAAWQQRDDRRRTWEENGPRKLVRHSPEGASQAASELISASTNKTLTERESKAVLAAYGVPVVGEKLVQSGDEAASAATALGFPVVLKVESPDLPHKTEAGVIRLGLKTEAEVKLAFEAILAKANKVSPKPRLNGVLVQPMISAGTEIMVGAKVDPLFGPMIVVGLGGIMVELLKDTAVELAPITQSEARAMLNRLKGKAALTGFRGSEPVDLDKLAEVIVRLSEFADDQKDCVAELDVNPVICAGSRITVVDALIVRKV